MTTMKKREKATARRKRRAPTKIKIKMRTMVKMIMTKKKESLEITSLARTRQPKP